MCIHHIFHITPLMATLNTIMTSNANGVSPTDTHAEFCQPVYKPQTLAQFWYWGNVAQNTWCTQLQISFQKQA
jgi:hypothetical protein